MASSSLVLPGELWQDGGGGAACDDGSVIDNDRGSGDGDRCRLCRVPDDADGIASSADAVVRKVLRGIACMLYRLLVAV